MSPSIDFTAVDRFSGNFLLALNAQFVAVERFGLFTDIFRVTLLLRTRALALPPRLAISRAATGFSSRSLWSHAGRVAVVLQPLVYGKFCSPLFSFQGCLPYP